MVDNRLVIICLSAFLAGLVAIALRKAGWKVMGACGFLAFVIAMYAADHGA